MSTNTLKTLMRNYLSREESSYRSAKPDFLNEFAKASVDSSLPVLVEDSLWILRSDPERLERTFSFPSIQLRNHFISELLQYEQDFSHHGSISIRGNSVTVEVYTHDLMMVTELDKEYAGHCDLIFNDLQHWDLG